MRLQACEACELTGTRLTILVREPVEGVAKAGEVDAVGGVIHTDPSQADAGVWIVDWTGAEDVSICELFCVED